VFYDPNEGNLDLYLYEPGPAGVTSSIDFSWDDGAQTGVLNVGKSLTPSDPAGDYLLKVVPYDVIGSGSFANLYMVEATVTRSCINDGLEPSNQTTPGSLGAFPYDSASDVRAMSGNLALCGEDDWYEIVPNITGQVAVRLGFSNSAGNIDLTLYDDAAGTSIIGGHAGTADCERAVFTATAGASYFAKVFMASLGNTSYSLQVGPSASIPSCP